VSECEAPLSVDQPDILTPIGDERRSRVQNGRNESQTDTEKPQPATSAIRIALKATAILPPSKPFALSTE
jgi:hypothetical protein